MTIRFAAPQGVQCQRGRRYIPAPGPDSQTWVCPFCPGHETYRRVDSGVPREVVGMAMAMCRAEFGVEDDGVDTVVWLGQGGETVFEAAIGAYHVYLSRDANPLQILYQGSHEAFHRVCAPPVGVLHWLDEMLAVHFSLVFLERIGQVAHADINRTALRADAENCSPAQMTATSAVSYPEGLYGRAYLVGEALIEAVGWDLFKLLAATRGSDGKLCLETWIHALTQPARDKATNAVRDTLGSV